MHLNKVLLHNTTVLASRLTSKLEGEFLLAVRDCLFDIFAAIISISSWIHNLRMFCALCYGCYTVLIRV